MSIINALISPEKLFRKELEGFKSQQGPQNSYFREEEINKLPLPLQRYFNQCGYSGTKIADLYEVIWSQSYIKMAPAKSWMKLKTLQYNFVPEPARIAWMKTWMMGLLPFEGRDKYHQGKGHMYGTLAKLIRIFDSKEPEIAQSALIVLLAESLIIPGYVFQDYLSW